MSILDDISDWLKRLAGAASGQASATASAEDPNVYLPQPKPGALVTDQPAHFPDPSSLPVATFFDLQTAPDYSRVGIGPGQSASQQVASFIASITGAWAPAPVSPGGGGQAFTAPSYTTPAPVPTGLSAIVTAALANTPTPITIPSAPAPVVSPSLKGLTPGGIAYANLKAMYP